MEVKNINKETTISIGLFITGASALVFIGALFNRVTNVESRVDIVEAKVEQLPSQNEYKSLKEILEQRFTGIEKSIEELKKK